MLTILDSSYFLPDDVGLRAAKAAGIDGWFGYIGDHPDHVAAHWPKQNFDRIKASGLLTGAYVSAYADPNWIKATAVAFGIRTLDDIEAGIRGDDASQQPFLDATGSAAYGNTAVHHHSAPGHVLANYPGGDPKATWPSWLARPSGMLAWQCIGTHDEHGGPVDRSYFDDSWRAWLAMGEVHYDMTPAQATYRGALHIFEIGADKACWHGVQKLGQDFASVGLTSLGGAFMSGVSAVVSGDDFLQLVGQGADGSYYRSYSADGLKFSPWEVGQGHG